MKIIFSPKSSDDLENIYNYYHQLNAKTAKKYIDNIIRDIENLKKFPDIGRYIPELLEENIKSYRELIYEHFRTIYRVSLKTIFIIRIIDSRQLLKLDMIK